MIRKLLFLLTCAVTSTSLWAQSLSFSPSTDGKTLTINASGNLPDYSAIDESKKVFTSTGGQNVYSNNSGATVGGGSAYDPSATYYYADKTWSLLFDGGAPSGNTYVYNITTNSSWNPSAIGTKYIYEYEIQWDNSYKIKGSDNQYPTWKNDYLSIDNTGAQYKTYLVMTSTQYTAETSAKSLPSDAVLLTKDNISTYINSSTTYVCNSSVMYVSTDGGTTKTALISGTTYTYTEGETFYTYTNSYAQIEDNATFFTEHSDYLAVSPSTYSAAQIIANNVKAGAYSKVEFANTDAANALTINYSIISAILYPNGANTYNTDIVTLDLGQTTVSGLNTKDFIDNTTDASYYVNNINVTDLTIPLVPAVDGEVIVPADVISSWQTNDTKGLHEHLTTVRIPEGYTQIGDNAFRSFSHVSTFVLPSTLKKIGENAFRGSGAIKSMTLPEGLTYIGKRAFMGTSLTGMNFPSTLDKIDDGAFANIVSYAEVILNDGLRYIGNGAFCRSQAENQDILIIPSSVKYIGPAAFGFRYYKDVYYSSEVAPISPFGDNIINDNDNISCFFADMYMGNNGNQSSPSTAHPLADYNNQTDSDGYGFGYANRENYMNGTWFGMLHFPTTYTDANKTVVNTDNYDTYKDHTRVYLSANHTSAFGFNNKSKSKGVGIIVPLPEGVETEPDKSYNGLSLTGSADEPNNLVSTGYWDTYRDEAYIWPSQNQWMRAFIEASCGYQWNGVTEYRPQLTVAELKIFNEAGYLTNDQLSALIGANTDETKIDPANVTDTDLKATYDNLQKIAYMGTRQFVFADGDVETEDPGDEPEYHISMKGENWWTICLPFNMTKAQVDNVFGEGTHVCLFSGVDREVAGNNKSITLKFQNDVYSHYTAKDEDGTYASNFSKTSSAATDDQIVIRAHEPYMIYPKKGSKDAVTMYTITDYEMVPGSPVPTIVKANAAQTGEGVDHTEYRYVGNYVTEVTSVVRDDDGQVIGAEIRPMTVPAYSYVYASADGGNTYKFWFLEDSQMSWKANKCVVQATAVDGGYNDSRDFFGLNQNQAKQTTILGELDDDSLTTGVEHVTIVAGEDTISGIVYNLNGQIVSNNGLRGLGKGVYIMNGKKFTVR